MANQHYALATECVRTMVLAADLKADPGSLHISS